MPAVRVWYAHTKAGHGTYAYNPALGGGLLGQESGCWELETASFGFGESSIKERRYIQRS